RRGHGGSRLDLFRGGLGEIRDLVYLLTPKEIMPHAFYRQYAWIKRRVRRFVKATHLTIINYCEQAPNPLSRVRLGERRDALGMPTLVLDWRIGEEATRSLRRLHALLDE